MLRNDRVRRIAPAALAAMAIVLLVGSGTSGAVTLGTWTFDTNSDGFVQLPAPPLGCLLATPSAAFDGTTGDPTAGSYQERVDVALGAVVPCNASAASPRFALSSTSPVTVSGRYKLFIPVVPALTDISQVVLIETFNSSGQSITQQGGILVNTYENPTPANPPWERFSGTTGGLPAGATSGRVILRWSVSPGASGRATYQVNWDTLQATQ